MIAASALGMGVDIPNVKKVIIFGVPESMEAYQQAVGRVDRDGSEVSSIMYYHGYRLCHCDPTMRTIVKKKSSCRHGESGCTRTHHRTLQGESQEMNVFATASACSNTSTPSDTCLLLMQSVKTKNGWANVMWDSAASLCFITNTKPKLKICMAQKRNYPLLKLEEQAKDLLLTSTCYHSSIRKAKSLNLKYMEKITTDIESVNVDKVHVVNLSKDVALHDIKRLSPKYF